MIRLFTLSLLLAMLSGCKTSEQVRVTPTAAPEAPGRALFATNCSTCHQIDGRGVSGSYPPLDGSEWLAGDPEAPIAVVLMGLEGEVTVKGETFNSQMPTLDVLSDAELAQILTYARSSWTNSAGPVAPEQVAAVRAKLKDRKTPWNGEAELREFLGAKAPKVG